MQESGLKILLWVWLLTVSIPLLGFVLLTFLIFLGWSAPNPSKEAQLNVNVINRAQHAHFIENESFAESIDKLEIIISPKNKDYYYKIDVTDKAVFTYAIANSLEKRTNYWLKIIPIHPESIPNYVGAVFVFPNREIATVLCRSLSPYKTEVTPPSWQNQKLVCAQGTEEI